MDRWFDGFGIGTSDELSIERSPHCLGEDALSQNSLRQLHDLADGGESKGGTNFCVQ